MTSRLIDASVGRFHILDALRGLAALVVVWHHLVVLFPEAITSLKTSTPGIHAAALWISDQNRNAVLAFFVLSGVSIRLAIAKDDLFEPGGISRYAKRRSARILPLYWLALGWTAALGAVHAVADPSFSLKTLAGNLLFLQTSSSARGNWFPPFGLNGPLWSLSYEIFYYATLPLILTAIGPRRMASPHAMNILLLVSVVTSIFAIGTGAVAANPFTNFLSLWAVWVYGYVLGDVLLRPRRVWSVLVPAPAVLLMAVLAGRLNIQSDNLDQLANGLVIGTLFGAAALIGRALHGSVLGFTHVAFTAPLLRIGRGSYALYLLHYPLLLALTSEGHLQKSPWFWPAAILSVFFAAFVVCPLLEQKLKKPGQKLFGLSPLPLANTKNSIEGGPPKDPSVTRS